MQLADLSGYCGSNSIQLSSTDAALEKVSVTAYPYHRVQSISHQDICISTGSMGFSTRTTSKGLHHLVCESFHIRNLTANSTENEFDRPEKYQILIFHSFQKPKWIRIPMRMDKLPFQDGIISTL